MSNEWRQIDDLEIIDIVDLDSEDEEVINGVKFTEDTAERLLHNMIFAYDGEAGLSKHFREKYPNFDGFFNRRGLPTKYKRYDGKIMEKYLIELYKAAFIYNECIYSDIEIGDLYRGLKYKYNLKFVLDENKYLDDYEMELISKGEWVEKNRDIEIFNELYKHPTNSTFLETLSGKNRNWQGLPISYSFRQKYNEKDGIFSNLEVDWVEFLCDTIGVKKYPVCLHLQDGSIKYYGLIFKLTDTNLIDNIEKIELDVDNNKIYTAEELLKMY